MIHIYTHHQSFEYTIHLKQLHILSNAMHRSWLWNIHAVNKTACIDTMNSAISREKQLMQVGVQMYINLCTWIRWLVYSKTVLLQVPVWRWPKLAGAEMKRSAQPQVYITGYHESPWEATVEEMQKAHMTCTDANIGQEKRSKKNWKRKQFQHK